jgi:predicted nucleotidyltransferase
MNRVNNPNLQILEAAVDRLGPLTDEFVFLGGCATALLINDAAAPPIRETIDVDVIVQVLSRAAYYALSDRLRDRGFKEDSSDGAPICRWTDGQVILDVMPTDPKILSFGNEWYEPAMDCAIAVELPSGKSIRMVSAPYFLITKLAAFDGRGDGDFQMSHDIEDLVAVVDGRPSIVDEVSAAEPVLRAALSGRFGELLGNSRFVDAISGHLPTDTASQARVPIVIGRMKQVAESQ